MSDRIRILVAHPGHGHSTSDVYEGVCAGLEMNDVEVVRFEWGRMLQPITALVLGAVEGGAIKDERAEKTHQWLCWMASADALTMAIEHEVNAVLVINGLLFPPSRTKVFRDIGLPIACYGTEAPYFEATERQLVPFYTHWFTQERSAVKRYSDLGTPVSYLPMAYNPKVHHPGPTDPDKRCDVTFVGGGFPERKQLIEGVDWTGVDITIHGTLWGLDLQQERGRFDFSRGTRYTEGAIPNEQTSAWHRSSKIALNLHRKMGYIETGAAVAPGLAESLGPRAYEIPACGGFMLSDDERPELADVLGDSAATFRAWDSDDLARQARYWLAHPDERERRRRAQHEAIRPHHWGARAKAILETLL